VLKASISPNILLLYVWSPSINLSSSFFQVKNILPGLVPRRSTRIFPYMPVVEVYNSMFFHRWPYYFDYIQCGTHIMKFLLYPRTLTSLDHNFPPICLTSTLFPCRATNHLTQQNNKIWFSSFLFKNVIKYTLHHVKHESDHTLCTVIPIVHHSLEFSAIWVSLIDKVLTKARRLTGWDSNFTALTDGHSISIITIVYNFGVSGCVCSVYIVSMFSVLCFLLTVWL